MRIQSPDSQRVGAFVHSLIGGITMTVMIVDDENLTLKLMTKTVQEEVRNEDFEIIADQRREVLSDPTLGEKQKHFAGTLFARLMERFKGMTKRITERLAAIFRSPEKREEIQAPIRESIREVLARSRAEADALNAARRLESDRDKYKTQQNRNR